MSTATYVVQLESTEKQALEAVLKKGRHSARELRRARVLLLADAGKSTKEIQAATDMSAHPECEETLLRRGPSVEGQSPSRSAEKARQLRRTVSERPGLQRRIDSLEKRAAEAQAWAQDRNARKQGVTWCFTTKDARRKRERFYAKN